MNSQQFTDGLICILCCLINPLFHDLSQEVLGPFLRYSFENVINKINSYGFEVEKH